MFKLIIWAFVIFVLYTIGNNVYQKRDEICVQDAQVIAEEEVPAQEAVDPNAKQGDQWIAKIKNGYNNGIEKTTASVIDVVKKFKCDNTNETTNEVKE